MSPRKSPLLNFVISAELLDRLDIFYHEHRFPSRAAAVKWLLEAALDAGIKPETKQKK